MLKGRTFVGSLAAPPSRTSAPHFIKLISQGGVLLQGGECFGVNLIVQTSRMLILLEITGRMVMGTVKALRDPAWGGGAAVIAACMAHLPLYKESQKRDFVPLLSLRVSSQSPHFM